MHKEVLAAAVVLVPLAVVAIMAVLPVVTVREPVVAEVRLIGLLLAASIYLHGLMVR